MKDLLKIASCFLYFGFETVSGMQSTIQDSNQSLKHFPSAMSTVTMKGNFLIVPISEVPTLYLVSREGTESFIGPKTDIIAIKSVLYSNGFNKVFQDSGSLESSSKELRRDNMMPISTGILPEGISSAINFFTNYNSKVPEDEKSLFFLRSLLLLGKADDTLLNNIEDKLSEYESYYQADPYRTSSNHLHDIGIYEYKKMFTEECFNDLQLVLEFSRLTKIQNADCRRDFEIFFDALKVIVETTKEDNTNAELLRKFKYLYKRMLEK